MTTQFCHTVRTAFQTRTARFQHGWLVKACLLLAVLLATPVIAPAQNLGNFCPIGTCDITNPHYVNVYWDSSLAQWDTDVATVTTDMGHDHIDHLTEALIHSQYFSALTQYSVTSTSLGSSLSGAGCLAAPATLDKALSSLPTLVNCILALNPSLNADNTILNVYVPPQSMPVKGFCGGKGSELAEHGQYGTSVGVTFIPANKACAGSLAALFGSATHEMVEATTDPNPPSPTGWKDGEWGDFYGQEVADLCENTSLRNVGYMFGKVASYWSDSLPGCTPGFAMTAPTITTATSCGAGQSMSLTLTGSFGSVPWDLASLKFGKQTLYLNARINHGGKTWEAGNFEGLPSDAVNTGKPDVVSFGAGGVTWSSGTITVAGFNANYGKTMANGAIAKVSPGDQITVKVGLNDTGQFATTNVTAPSGSQILNLAVGKGPWIFVNDQPDVTGTVADSGKCGIQDQLVQLTAWQGTVSPGSAGTSASGVFQSFYIASSVAGTQKVTAYLSNNNSVTASVNAPVHPDLYSISPNIGPVAGGQNATLSGDGYDPGNTSVAFSGASAAVKTVTLNSIQVVTPKSPLGGDGDGTADVIATVNGLDSFSVPYQYIVPGKPYIKFNSTSCKNYYVEAIVYDANAKPVVAPIKFTASYPAYFSGGVWNTSATTTSGVWVQVDKGGPFTATNTNNNLSNTASFPVLPGPICANVRLITKVDWHIFEKPGDLREQEVAQLDPAGVATGGKKVIIWTSNANVKEATNYVLDPAGLAGGGGLQVRTVGAEQFRSTIHGRIFFSGPGGMKTESATGGQAGNVLEVQFAGPAFSITRTGQREDAAAPLGRELRLSFGLPQGYSNPHTFHIVHLTMLDGQPTWAEDGATQTFPYNSGLTRMIDQSGVYALVEEVGTATETEPAPQQPSQPQQPPAQPQAAPPNSTILVPANGFQGGLLTGVVIGPDNQPVPNTPVQIAGGVPATLTGEVVGEQPCSPNDPACQPTTGQQPPARQQPPQKQRPPGDHPQPGRPPVDCATLLQQATPVPLPTPTPVPGQAAPNAPAGAVAPTAAAATGPGGGPGIVTDAAGRFALCMLPNVPAVSVNLPGAAPVPVPAVEGQPSLPSAPPGFFQPGQNISIIGVLRNPTATQSGRTWLLPAVQAWSPNGQQVISAFKTPNDLQPGAAQISYTGGDGQTHQVQGTVFKIVRAFLDRSQLHSDQGATFEYDVLFDSPSGEKLCVEMHVAGPIVLVKAPPTVIPVDASGLGKFVGKIRAVQVAPGSTVPFDLSPDIHVCKNNQ
jgi:hypothetical protein